MFLKFNSNICRVCLEQEGKISLFDKPSIVDQFRFCTLLEATENDELPLSLCMKCYKCLRISNEFKIKAISSDNYLRKFIATLNKKFSNALINKHDIKATLDIDINELYSLLTSEPATEETTTTTTATHSTSQTTTVTFKDEKNNKNDNLIQTEKNSTLKMNATLSQNDNNSDSNVFYKIDIKCSGNDDDNGTDLQQLCDITEEQEVNEDETHKKTNQENEIQQDNTIDIISIEENLISHENDGDIVDIVDVADYDDDNEHDDENETNQNSLKISSLPQIIEQNQNKRKMISQHNKLRKKYKNHLIDPNNFSEDVLLKNDTSCVCVECNKTFSSKPNLMRHILTHVNAKPFQCNVCGDCFTQNGSLKTHMLRHTGERPYKCNICNKTFARKRILIIHSRIHTGDKPYECEECNQRFRVKESLKRHNAFKHSKGELKEYPCTICERILSSKYTLDMHIKLHRGEKELTVQCHVCDKSFANKYSLRNHMKNHNQREENYQCKECKQEFKTRKSYKLHIKKHDDNNSKINSDYQCSICDKILSKKFKYIQHLLTHEDEKILNYSCRKCAKDFTVKENLIEHLRTHIDYVFKCKQCHVGFNIGRDLKLHRLNFHKENINDLNMCDDCGITFVTGLDLNVHIATQHDIIDIECEECEKHFISKRLYKEHTLEHDIIDLTERERNYLSF